MTKKPKRLFHLSCKVLDCGQRVRIEKSMEVCSSVTVARLLYIKQLINKDLDSFIIQHREE